MDTSHAIVVEIVWGDSAAFGRAAYDRGHVPGAVAWDFENDLQDPGRRDIVGTAGIERLLSSSGITATTTIVVYSGLDNLLATYAFWLLKVYRHRDVRLLDGGKALWLAEGRNFGSGGIEPRRGGGRALPLRYPLFRQAVQQRQKTV